MLSENGWGWFWSKDSDGLVVGGSGHQLHVLYNFTAMFGPLSNFLSKEHTVFENHRKSLTNIASEASYIYILNGQKLIESAKKN